MQEWYHGWGWRPKKMTKKQIKDMINNMKKSDIIRKKSEEYHREEEKEAENIMKDLNESL